MRAIRQRFLREHIQLCFHGKFEFTLLPANVETLLFLRCNLRAINYNCDKSKLIALKLQRRKSNLSTLAGNKRERKFELTMEAYLNVLSQETLPGARTNTS